MTDTIEIRPTRLTDLPSLVVDCLNPVFAERVYLGFTSPRPVGETIGFFASNIEAGYPNVVAVDTSAGDAAVGGRVVGICDIVPAAPPHKEAALHCASLGMLLSPAYRGRGLGEKLLLAALAAAQGKWERIELSVYTHNERAHRLYTRVGFVEEGRRIGAWKLDGVTSDIIMMVLHIGEPRRQTPAQ
jgi:RimJ/RimL family protein N-acetyltransferase